jgi:undecaprenyl diphosphate synthase
MFSCKKGNGCNSKQQRTNEITHAIEASVNETTENAQITMSNLERNMYMAGFVEPDIRIRTSDETRLSNFLLWQSDFTHLQNPNPLCLNSH